MTVVMLFVSKLLATPRPSKWFKPSSIRSSYCVIVRVRVYVSSEKNTELITHRLTNTIHHSILKMASTQVVETPVTNSSSFRNYPQPDEHVRRTILNSASFDWLVFNSRDSVACLDPRCLGKLFTRRRSGLLLCFLIVGIPCFWTMVSALHHHGPFSRIECCKQVPRWIGASKLTLRTA